MNESVSIIVNLCNRPYRIKVAAENETTVRQTAQKINTILTNLKSTFPGRDDQDYLAMALIDHITSGLANDEKSTLVIDEILPQLKMINNLLDE